MNKALNYFGQLRIYSLVDLWLLLVVAHTTNRPLWGAVLLHIGFLGYLESRHKRLHREPVPLWFVLVAWAIGFVLFVKPEGVVYLFLSVLYANKKRWRLGLVSPIIRGLQTLVMIGAICGYNQMLPWLAMGLMVVRNFLGDLRDAQEDAKEGKWTWPSALKMKSRPFAHLLGIFATTLVWWRFAANLSGWLLAAVLIVEVGTYWITPRQSNKNAAAWLHNKILRAHFRR